MATAKTMTLEEFLEMPEEEPALEYEFGRVVQKVLPQGKHSVLQLELAQLIDRWARPPKLARAFPELRTTYSGFSRVPDVAVYRWERVPRDERGQVANRFLEPPDIAIEIVSPEQRVSALIRRCLDYVEKGVPIALLVDPGGETVRRFTAGQSVLVLRGTNRIDLDAVLPGFSLTVAELFDSLNMS